VRFATRFSLVAGGMYLGVQACTQHSRGRSRGILPDPDILRDFARTSLTNDTKKEQGTAIKTSNGAQKPVDRQREHMHWLAHLVEECKQQEHILDQHVGEKMVKVGQLVHEQVCGAGSPLGYVEEDQVRDFVLVSFVSYT
jgi:hypothetical protein